MNSSSHTGAEQKTADGMDGPDSRRFNRICLQLKQWQRSLGLSDVLSAATRLSCRRRTGKCRHANEL